MTLKEFARQHLVLESRSTNPAHKRFLGFNALDNLSQHLTDAQYKQCKEFVDNDFDETSLDDSEVSLPTEINT